MFLMIIKCIISKTVYEKILAVNVFGTLTALIILVISFIRNDMEFIDVALIYALVNFITTIAFLKFFKYRSF